MIQLFIKRSLVLAMFLSLFVACSSENSPVQAENSNTDTNDQTDAVADVIQLENGDFVVEGDMVFTPEQLVSSNVLKKGSAQSALFRVNNYEWGPNAVIEYYFVPANSSLNLVSMSTNEKREFARALKDLSNGAAISFKEVSTPSTHTVYVYKHKGDISSLCGRRNKASCASVGKVSSIGKQNYMRFSEDDFSTCTSVLTYRTFFHEMTHVLGFIHEHQRNDRGRHVTLSVFGSDFDKETGNTLDTPFDMASIMMYDLPYVQVKQGKEEVYDWMGGLPLPSPYDGLARKRVYGFESETQNLYSIRHISGKYLCRSTTGENASLLLKTTKSSLCIWDITSGSLNLGQTSQYSGIVLDHNFATTIRSTETTRQGFGIYLGYGTKLGLSVQGSLRYASKWIPIISFYTGGYINLWNPLGYCLTVSNDKLTVNSLYCSEDDVWYRLEYAGGFGEIIKDTNYNWSLVPEWNTKVPY